MNNENIITTNELTKKYKGKIALYKASIELKEGEICALLGPNGSGKSTLMKIICGLTSQTSGEFTTNNVKIGYMIEYPCFYDDLTGRENLIALSKLFNNVSDNDVDLLIAMMGLKNHANKKYKNYSFGMKQRLYFAYALIGKPKVLILDEPFNGIDYRTVVEFENIIRSFASNGGSVLISSHIIGEISKLCNSIYILNEGTIVYSDKNLSDKNLDQLYLSNILEDINAQ